eukprot:TRINITY_DN664_c0_g1_i1.p1 TRINITY_DN664_c0_g1~~TRINITY_DN664_c0_g1_i1.p1  ORF type:complete len:341 (-),score=44.52 TRINITY_DN664_c0_g1_i1:1148-2170(-)
MMRTRSALRALACHSRSLGSTGLIPLPLPARRKMSYVTEMQDEKPPMFCYQCEQTAYNKGCVTVGLCGKRPKVSALQDMLIHMCKGISQYAHAARQLKPGASDPEVDRFVLHAIFTTLTNVNFDRRRFFELIREADEMRNRAKALFHASGGQGDLAGPASMTIAAGCSDDALLALAETTGVLARADGVDEDVFAMIELITYGIKGTAAYAHHAIQLGEASDEIFAGLHRTMSVLTDPVLSLEKLLPVALELGALNLTVMSLLEKAHINALGKQEPTEVTTMPVPGKCIFVSGHDLNDLRDILEQTAGTGINVYTHGEMLPGCGYPELKKHPHLVGHFGRA